MDELPRALDAESNAAEEAEGRPAGMVIDDDMATAGTVSANNTTESQSTNEVFA